MFKSYQNLSINKKLLIPGIIFLVGFVLYSVISYQALEKLRVNGPVYKKIILGKDLIADILPPPEYIIEAKLICHQMVDETNAETLNTYLEKCSLLKKDYLARQEYWQKELSEGEMKTLMLDTAYKPAMTFFEIRDSEFIPALRRGDRDKAKALLQGPMMENYEKHRKAIDQIVVMANDSNALEEKQAEAIIASRKILTLSVGVFACVLALGISIITNSVISKKLRQLAYIAKRIAVGDLSFTSKFSDSQVTKKSA